MSDVWAILVPCALAIVIALVGLVTVIPYLDGRQEIRRDKWIRAHAVAWACYKRGRSDAIRKRDLLYARYMARKEDT